MRAMTLWEAYTLTLARQRHAVSRRGSRHGILVDDDRDARKYQRYKRLEYKLAYRLEEILQRVDEMNAYGEWS